MQSLSLAIALALTTATLAAAQGTTVIEEKPGLLKLAKISALAATTAALARVPNGKVEKAEIEEEKGKLIYSFDIKVAGKSGTEEVAVDAITGKVLSVEHESPKQEAKEKAADAAKEQAAAKEKAATKAKPAAAKKP